MFAKMDKGFGGREEGRGGWGDQVDRISCFPKFTLLYALFIPESLGHILQEYLPHLPTVSPRLPATCCQDTSSAGFNNGVTQAGLGQLLSA